MKGAFEKEPVEEIAKAGVEHNQHQRDLRQLMVEEMMFSLLAWAIFFHSWDGIKSQNLKEKEQQDVETVELKKVGVKF